MTFARLLSDPRFSLHRANAYHPERPERLDAAHAAVLRAQEEAGIVFTPVAARHATADELARVHDESFVKWLDTLRGEEGYVDADTFIGKDSVDVALLAAGGAIALVDAVIDEPQKRALGIMRPPGHHARAGQAMGFCLVNNVAVAAAHARARGFERVAIIDWDVHHGNGTQEMFFADPNVLYVSTHQFPFYPGTGAVLDVGEGDGTGYTINVPLTAGGGDSVYRGAFERVILPALDQYRPDLVLVSAGFDGSARDPLAEMTLSAEAFGWMGKALTDIADRHSDGRVVMLLEGGYDLVALESGLLSATKGMVLGEDPSIARDMDNEDVVRASQIARKSWRVD